MLNRFFAILILLVLSPLFLLVAISILIEDGSPLLFKQKRVGINYTFFNIYKFRSMKKNTPNVATHLLTNPEQYLLKIGRILRKLSLDELPNLINIIKPQTIPVILPKYFISLWQFETILNIPFHIRTSFPYKIKSVFQFLAFLM